MQNYNPKFKITQRDCKRYVLKEPRDYRILAKICNLEKQKLLVSDKQIIKLIKTQLEKDWRKPLLNFLDKLINKYDK